MSAEPYSEEQVDLPIPIRVYDFDGARRSYLARLSEDCINDAHSFALTNQMLGYAEQIWPIVRHDKSLWTQFVCGLVLEREPILVGAVLEAARRVSDAAVAFFEADAHELFWDRYEFLRALIDCDLVTSSLDQAPGVGGA